MGLYRTYAPAYPHYFVYPVQQKVMPVMDAEDEMMDDQKETEMMEDVVRKEEQFPTQSYNPLTSYYPVYQPVYHPLMPAGVTESSFLPRLLPRSQLLPRTRTGYKPKLRQQFHRTDWSSPA